MTFAEMALDLDNSCAEISDVLSRCSAFAESSYNEYMMNLKEAELKVIKESGTDEDLLYLREAASEGYLVRAKNTIKKIVESVAEFFAKIAKSIKDFFASKKTEDAINTADDAIKKNPKLKNVKVKVNDEKAVDSVIKKHEAQVDRKIAQFKAGKFTSSDDEELDKIEKSFIREHAKAIAATTVLSAAAVIMVLKSHKKDINPTGYKVKVIDLNNDTTPEQVGKIIKATKIRADIEKEKGNSLTRSVKSAFSALKGIATQSRDINAGNMERIRKSDMFEESAEDVIIDVSVHSEMVEESAEEKTLDTDAMLANILEEVEESARLDSITEEEDDMTAEEYLESLEERLFGDDEEPVQESYTDDSALVTAEEYLEAMEAELFGDDEEVAEESTNDSELVTAEEYLESMEAELFGDDEEVAEESVEDVLSKIEAELFE